MSKRRVIERGWLSKNRPEVDERWMVKNPERIVEIMSENRYWFNCRIIDHPIEGKIGQYTTLHEHEFIDAFRVESTRK